MSVEEDGLCGLEVLGVFYEIKAAWETRGVFG